MQTPELYETTVQLDVADLDPSGCVRMPVLVDWMQRVADAHAQALGVGREAMVRHGVVWLLARLHVRLNAPLQKGALLVKTWPGRTQRAICPRYFSFETERGAQVGAAATAWTLMDLRAHRLTTAQKSGLPFDPQGAIPPSMALPGRMAGVRATRDGVLREAMYSDLDVNGHVNNARYANWVCDLLGPACLQTHYVQALQLNYHREILPGVQVRLCSEREGDEVRVCGVSEAETLHFEAQVHLAAR